MTLSAGHLAQALHRTAIGDHNLEAALDSVVRSGLDLPTMLAEGLITLEPDLDELGGGWWAEIQWLDVLDALDTGHLPATPFQTYVVRAAAAACGQPITAGQRLGTVMSPTEPPAFPSYAIEAPASLPPWSGSVLIAHDKGPRAGHLDAIPAHLASRHLVYDGPTWLGVYRRTSPLQMVDTQWGAAEVWTVVQ